MEVVRSIVVPCPPERVWELLTDWERQSDWMVDADRVTVESETREGPGVRLQVRTRLFGIPAFTEPMEVVTWEPPSRLVIVHGGPVAGTGIWELVPSPAGTLFTWTEDVRLRVPFAGEVAARIYAPVMRWLMGRAMRSVRSAVA